MNPNNQDDQNAKLAAQLLQVFTAKQIEFMIAQAKTNDYGYIVIGMKKTPDVLLFIPSFKLPKD